MQPLKKAIKAIGATVSTLFSNPLSTHLTTFKHEDWENLEASVNLSQKDFAVKLRAGYPKLSEKDIHIILLIRIGMSHADIARLLNIDIDAFRMRRYRLKQKMGVKDKYFSRFIKRLYR